ncbi:MAG: T9SS type A sorting domain-containing protein [Candidatus Marinimicrobia bacterium]|nr:T9SS type A sorting domain-containing protein [Candidatus Neomarinimicrobiota bacterium]
MRYISKLILIFLLAAALYGGPGRLIPPAKSGVNLRPDGLNQTYNSPAGLFVLHYTNTGNDSVPQVYSTDTGVPDYILYAATYLERGYRLLKDTLNLPLPPVDDIRNPEIDIYFRHLGYGVYGQTTAELSKALPGRPKAYTAFSEIHHTLTGPGFFTEGLDALKVTCVHELFHVFQVGIGIWNLNEDMWFYETSATWIEELAYPDVNDYFQYVDRYVNNWGKSIHDYIYDNVTWLIFLNNIYKGEASSAIWNAIAEQSVWPSITDFLMEKNSSQGWAGHLAAWGMEHLYADYLPELSHFEDGEAYSPLLFPAGSFRAYSVIDSFTIVTYGEPFSSSFYKIQHITTPSIQLRILSPGNVSGKAWSSGSHTRSVDLSREFTTISGAGEPWDLLIALGTDEAYTIGEPLRITLDIREGESSLLSLYPNPVTDSRFVTIRYHLKDDSEKGILDMYDILGREINSLKLYPEETRAGLHTVTRNIPETLASGVYIMVLRFDNHTFPAKVTLLK